MRYRYILGERRTFVYHNPSPCELVYYQGQRIDIVRDEPPLEYSEDVSYVCFDDRESARHVVKCSYSRNTNFSLVLRALDYIYDSNIKKHLVCFTRFDGFLPQADPKLLAGMENPNSSDTCPGNPNKVVQSTVKWVISTLIHMHWEVGVSSSLLHLPVGYVCCGEGLKIFMLDSCKEDYTDAQWNKIMARDVERFGTGLNEYFLKSTLSWPEKESFMRCFSIRLPEEDKRLRMMYDHPFLQNSIEKILHIFTSVHHSLRSTYHSRLELTKLMAALKNSKQFKSEFMSNGVWTRPKMSSKFKKFLRGKPKGNSLKYDTKDLGDLLRFLRNLYENGYKKRMTVEYMYRKIRRYWPHLMDRFHEKTAGYSRRTLQEFYYDPR